MADTGLADGILEKWNSYIENNLVADCSHYVLNPQDDFLMFLTEGQTLLEYISEFRKIHWAYSNGPLLLECLSDFCDFLNSGVAGK